MFEQEILVKYIPSVLWVLLVGLLGIIIEKIVLIRLEQVAKRTSWEGDDIIIRSVKGKVMPLVLLAGLYAGLLSMPLDQTIKQTGGSFLIAAAVLLGTAIISKVTVGLVTLYSKTLAHVLPSSSIFVNIARIAVIVCGGLIALQTLGISITPLITALGVGGLAVALAFQDTLSNLFAGLQILVSQQMKPGDYVRIEDGSDGVVEDITWRNTTIRSLHNNLIIVPNSKLATSVIMNYNRPAQDIIVPVTVGVSYDSDLEKVERVTLEVAAHILKTVPGGNSAFTPLVRFHTFGESSVDANVILSVKAFADQGVVKHEFMKALHARYNAEGIEIPFPVRTVVMKK